jgi:hypothetical protein
MAFWQSYGTLITCGVAFTVSFSFYLGAGGLITSFLQDTKLAIAAMVITDNSFFIPSLFFI